MTERSPTFNWHLLTVNEWINGLINHTFNLCFHAFVFSFTHFAVNQLLLLPLRRGLPNPRVTILNKKEPIFGNENHWETLEKCELGLILPIENKSKLILNSFRCIKNQDGPTLHKGNIRGRYLILVLSTLLTFHNTYSPKEQCRNCLVL